MRQEGQYGLGWGDILLPQMGKFSVLPSSEAFFMESREKVLGEFHNGYFSIPLVKAMRESYRDSHNKKNGSVPGVKAQESMETPFDCSPRTFLFSF